MICVVNDELVSAHGCVLYVFKLAQRDCDIFVPKCVTRRRWLLVADRLSAIKSSWQVVGVVVRPLKLALVSACNFTKYKGRDSVGDFRSAIGG